MRHLTVWFFDFENHASSIIPGADLIQEFTISYSITDLILSGCFVQMYPKSTLPFVKVKCVSKVFYLADMCHACFPSVHLQKKFPLNKRNDVLQGSFCILSAFTKNHPVIRIPHKSVPSACQFLIQVIQYDIAKQWT